MTFSAKSGITLITMSNKSDIYGHYYDKAHAHNESVGGEPECESFVKYSKRYNEIEALPQSNSWGHPTGRRGHLLPDGRVAELRGEIGSCWAHAFIFKNEAHHSGYRQILGIGQYFED